MNSRLRFCFALLVAGFLAALNSPAGDLTTAMPHAQGTRRMVLEQLERLLAADPGLQVIGQGSWLRGPAAKTAQLSRSYADPLLGGTSDHDLRLVMQGEDGQLLSTRRGFAESLQGEVGRGDRADADQELRLHRRAGGRDRASGRR
jgi:hypothetical protein